MRKLLGFAMMGVGVILLIVIASTFFFSSNAQSSVSEVTENIDGINELMLESKAVNWTIIPVSDKDLRISVSGDEVNDIFKVNRQGRSLEILTEQKNFRWFPSFFGKMVDREAIVYLPEEYTEDLIISTVSGEVTLDGDLTFQDVDVDMVSGSFSNTGLLQTDSIRFDSVSGNVDTSGLISQDVHADSVSGDVHLGYAEGHGDIDVDTVSGEVSIVSSDLNATYEFDTLSGAITDQGTRLKAREYSSSVGEGQYQITISTLSGDIVVE
ncbi:DUF4097 family beta strand repeat-containing protein [Alkalicoccobacillus murimartini]|uniref:DUF4097 and DUF4098 domain-containing protein YvlB n=1 Tax=Alkalicoccobacillus murimartini TaxID=171685 RepID=A0ABT9YBV9_9BACI|nr:DUF4097 family beta strand repeat-containing protein [Alkalicoccobacillus murimartini]MDQ0205325.1 DUF4097 and DUF4098 domain-containing protein YvlB [Alkalicoccobacillus murimartini]